MEVAFESISMQSVLCRCLGKLTEWPEIFGQQAKLGYNAIHFVPMQKYGPSGNMYSIRDQHSVDDFYIKDPNMLPDERLRMQQETIQEINEKHNLLCFADIELNHTAVNSDWLSSHPEAAYNLHNCPSLKVAYEFDNFLAKFSEDYSQKKIKECPNAPYVSNETHIQLILKSLNERMKSLLLDQYFLYNKKNIKDKFIEGFEKLISVDFKEIQEKQIDLLNYVQKNSFGYGEKPFGVEV